MYEISHLRYHTKLNSELYVFTCSSERFHYSGLTILVHI